MIKRFIYLWTIYALIVDCQINYPECSSFDETTLILKTKNGDILGSCYNISINYAYKPTNRNNPLLSWLSVPYAEPPVNNLRFKSPVPVQSWNATLDGTVLPKACTQGPFFEQINSEDCLYLNIYSPYNSYFKAVVQNDFSSLLPVFIWIHGGGFTLGSGSEYDGSTLAVMSNIVVVTINYRLGAFGFLHLKGTDAQGNQGLLDQHLALKWIYENAINFGGDKDRITIGGESAGSWSVGYHLLYKASWPYFRNAILQSGNPTTLEYGTLLLTSDQATSIASKIGSKIGCDPILETNNHQLLDCLQQVNVNLINLASTGLLTYPAFVLDDNVISDEPRKLFENGKFKRCNILTGFNNYAEISLAPTEINNDLINELLFGKMSSLRIALKKRLNIDDNYAEKIIQLYVPFQKLYDKTINLYYYFIEIITDYQFKCPTYQLGEYFSRYNNVYVYLYGHRSSVSDDPPVDGAANGDEIEMMFGMPLWESSSYSDSERLFSEQIVKYWASFIADNKPTLNNQWTKFDDKMLLFKRNIFYLKNSSIKIINIYPDNDLKCKFWSGFKL